VDGAPGEGVRGRDELEAGQAAGRGDVRGGEAAGEEGQLMYAVFTAPFRALLVEVVLPFLGAFGAAALVAGVLLGRRGRRG